MNQVICCMPRKLAAVNAFCPVMGNVETWDATEANRYQLIPTGGKLSKLWVDVATAPGAATSITFTLMYDGSPSTLTAVVSGVATTGSDGVHEVTVAAGHYVSIQATTSAGAPTYSITRMTLMFTGDTSGESILLSHLYAYKTTLNCFQPVGGYSSYGEDAVDEYKIMGLVAATSTGTNGLKKLYVKLSAASGAGGYVITARRNQANSALTCTVTHPATTGNDTVHTVNFAAGDRLALVKEISGTPTTSAQSAIGMVYTSDVDGESLEMGNDYAGTINSTKYDFPGISRTNAGWDATEANRYGLTQACTLRKLYVRTNSVISATKSLIFTVMYDASPSALTCTIAAGAQTANDITHNVTALDSKYLDVKCVITDAITQFPAWGFVYYIASAAADPFPAGYRALLKQPKFAPIIAQ